MKSVVINAIILCFRSNFLLLDIYYGELKYETVSQSADYGWIDFFSKLS